MAFCSAFWCLSLRSRKCANEEGFAKEKIQYPSPTDCEDIRWTYENVGKPFFQTWCTICHHEDLLYTNTDDDSEDPRRNERMGVYPGYDCHTFTGIQDYNGNIINALIGGSMPPDAVPPEEDIIRVLEWLDCGAPE